VTAAIQIPSVLTDVLAAELHDPGLRLRANADQGANSHAYVCTCSDGRELFVKVAPEEKIFRTRAVLAACRGCPFVPRLRCERLLVCGQDRALVTDRAIGRTVDSILALSDVQFRSWIDGYVELSGRIQSLRPLATAPKSYGRMSAMAGMLRDRIAGIPLAKFLLRDLLAMEDVGSGPDGRSEQVIHGDFSFNNFLFAEEGLSAVLDFDSLTTGLPCEDLLASFVVRYRDTSVRGSRYALLRERLRSAVERSPWPVEDWHAAIDLQRMRFAILNLSGSSVGILDVLRTRREDSRLARMHRDTGGF